MSPVEAPRSAALTDPDAVRQKPQLTVAALERAGLYGLERVELRSQGSYLTIIWLTLRPWAATAAEGYPTETISLCIWGEGTVYAIPHRVGDRTWMHRNNDTARRADLPIVPGEWGSLCLWYPNDPRALRWEWEDGLDQYVTIVHRHLQAEEYGRRHDRWPAEDAPHGFGPHHLRTQAMLDAAEHWRVAC